MHGTDLRARREALGLTQTGLAEALSVRQQHVSRWEAGTVPITPMRAAWLDLELSRIEAAHLTARPKPRP